MYSVQEVLPGYQRGKWLLERNSLHSKEDRLFRISRTCFRILLLLLLAIWNLGILLWRNLDRSAPCLRHGLSSRDCRETSCLFLLPFGSSSLGFPGYSACVRAS